MADLPRRDKMSSSCAAGYLSMAVLGTPTLANNQSINHWRTTIVSLADYLGSTFLTYKYVTEPIAEDTFKYL